MSFIYLNNKDFTEVDEEDYEYLINLCNWYLHKNNKGYKYVTGYRDGKKYIMHIVIAERLGLDCSNLIYHIDGNGLNNKSDNLRSATKSQNAMNHRNYVNNTTGFPGIHFSKRDNKYIARIQVNKKRIYIGRFDTISEADFVRKEFARKLFGEFYNPDI